MKPFEGQCPKCGAGVELQVSTVPRVHNSVYFSMITLEHRPIICPGCLTELTLVMGQIPAVALAIFAVPPQMQQSHIIQPGASN